MNFEELPSKIDILVRENLSQTAERMNYTQSTLTSKVKKMESDVGHPLFNRTPKGLKRTYAGNLYLNFLKQTLQSYQELIDQISDQTLVYPIYVEYLKQH